MPHVALDVVVELGGDAGERPKVWGGDLGSCGGPEVGDPLLVEDGRDLDDTVALQGGDLLGGDWEGFGRGHARVNAVGKGD